MYHVAYTDKKENEIFLIYKEIQMGSVAKSYLRNGFQICEEIRKYLVIYIYIYIYTRVHLNLWPVQYVRCGILIYSKSAVKGQ
jgi:hypothetical protein